MLRHIKSVEKHSQVYSLRPRKHGQYGNPEAHWEMMLSPARDPALDIMGRGYQLNVTMMLFWKN